MEIFKEIFWEAYAITFIIGVILMFIGNFVQKKMNERYLSAGGNILVAGLLIFLVSVITPIIEIWEKLPFYIMVILFIVLILLGTKINKYFNREKP